MDARLESRKIARIPDLLDLIKRLCSCCVSDGKNALDAYVSRACTMPMYQSLRALMGRDRPWRHSWLMATDAFCTTLETFGCQDSWSSMVTPRYLAVEVTVKA